MHRLRFTLAQLMAVIIFIGFGFAAIRNANEIWASATYTLAVLMVSLATLGALARKGRARVMWAGFALFGWVRGLVGVLPSIHTYQIGPIPAPELLTNRGFDFLREYLAMPRGVVWVPFQLGYSLDIILFGLIGCVAGRLLAAKDEPQSA